MRQDLARSAAGLGPLEVGEAFRRATNRFAAAIGQSRDRVTQHVAIRIV
jgi:hypothetical protein